MVEDLGWSAVGTVIMPYLILQVITMVMLARYECPETAGKTQKNLTENSDKAPVVS